MLSMLQRDKMVLKSIRAFLKPSAHFYTNALLSLLTVLNFRKNDNFIYTFWLHIFPWLYLYHLYILWFCWVKQTHTCAQTYPRSYILFLTPKPLYIAVWLICQCWRSWCLIFTCDLSHCIVSRAGEQLFSYSLCCFLYIYITFYYSFIPLQTRDSHDTWTQGNNFAFKDILTFKSRKLQ